MINGENRVGGSSVGAQLLPRRLADTCRVEFAAVGRCWRAGGVGRDWRPQPLVSACRGGRDGTGMSVYLLGANVRGFRDGLRNGVFLIRDRFAWRYFRFRDMALTGE